METEQVNGSAAPQPHYRTLDDERLTADEMDEQRKRNVAYEYLCHLEEAKIWIQACIKEDLPPTTELEEGMRNGVYLAKLAHFINPKLVPLKKIYDIEQTRFQSRGLHFRHTDNINHWLRAIEVVGLPKIFYPETTDIYDRKNMPRLIFCLHALSLYLFKLGLAPQIQDLYGKINFTEEEISAMRKELEKYGIQMPAFGKIGGILANEMSGDEAALHAAIIAINEAVEKGDSEETFQALQNPSAMLVSLDQGGQHAYQQQLFRAKQTKAENARNKSMDADRTIDQDIYDEILTQAEIQGNINGVNMEMAEDRLTSALLKGDAATVLAALKNPHLGLRNVKDDNIDFYIAKLNEAYQMKKETNNNSEEDVQLRKEDIQQAIDAANQEADTEYQKAQAVTAINGALESGDQAQLMRALQSPAAQLPGCLDSAAPLYLHELTAIRAEKQGDIDHSELHVALQVLNGIAVVNEAVDAGHPHVTFVALTQPEVELTEAEEQYADKYQDELAHRKAAKAQDACPLLTHGEVEQCIKAVHKQVQEEHERIQAIEAINEAIDEGEPEGTLAALQLPAAKLHGVEPQQSIHYQVVLTAMKDKKQEATKDDAAALWLEEIQTAVDTANQHAEEGLLMSRTIAAINQGLLEGVEDAELLQLMNDPNAGLKSITSDCLPVYREKLQKLQQEKMASGETGSGWMMNRLQDGHKFFYNADTGEYAWARPEGVIKDHKLLTREEIQGVLSEVTAAHERKLLFKANEGLIVKAQALIRGHQTRGKFRQRKEYLSNQEPAVKVLQAWYRGNKQRQAFQGRLQYLRDNEAAALKLQSYCRMWRQRKRYRDRLKFFRENEDSIVKIQAFFRSNVARNDYKALMQDDNPPLSVVRKFVHLLDASDNDYAEELELQKLRQQVVAEIRSNQQLEQDLDQMDIKIGLLIKNRITLQDVVSHNKKLTTHSDADRALRGLKAMSKESHERLQNYQHLFYLLQTNPTYLAKLIFEMPQVKTTKFMESVIYSLFNYGSNQREEYLLLKLFKTALEEEIARISKVDKMTDIVTGNPLVVKMIVGYNRSQRGQNALREMLNPLITMVIDDKNLRINTNPVEVYKAWVNTTESETGKASGLPYDVPTEQALKHPEVCQQIDESMKNLQNLSDQFLNKILTSLDLIPYGIRYMAKVMRQALMTKFPDAPEKDILKIVGNLLYYRYINSAIVAPDAFDIINVGADKALNTDQRRNLGSIAKILQFAASNKGFGGESAYLAGMNDYIRAAHEKFKRYCLAACEVEEPEVKFNIDQYTDVTMIAKPVIYISVQEIMDTHMLLQEHQDVIAPDHNDPLHELLEDLGEAPSIDELLGKGLTGDEGTNQDLRAELAKTEISLTLSSKFEVQHDEQADLKSVLIRSKRMIVDIIACQHGETLTQVLNTPATEEQEELHQMLVRKRDAVDEKVSKEKEEGKLVRHTSILGDTRLPLELMKTKVKKHLQVLEQAGMVSQKDHYQGLVNAIVQDIRNQRRYRHNRKQELVKLRATCRSLAEKKSFYESQIDYYNQYVKMCLANLQHKTTKHKKAGLFRKQPKADKKVTGSISYSAARLHEKGVVLEIEGLPQNQFKNVLFEISSTDDPGVFDVNAKFMGVQMEKVELVFQDLLQLQYEGVAVMKMFNKAKVNVNLLIFLLNRKFYGKKH